ncbi:replicative DNA helicase [Deinococcus ruber]|uniref:DNA 5'-3' helicase n=1 Tax=Deinococcus ruber TaxID=1848197 RepID=A0A918FCV2_9DEIO|nr:DnaB-like helicase C-terminal domain-containing protein [Deinococcus ruber]GGR31259.1 replicative DNA helicase [Deinococcus ruber]
MTGPNEARLWDRTPPFDEAAEIALLGGVMTDNDQWANVSDLPPEAFYRVNHRAVWTAMRALKTAGMAIDLVNLPGELSRTQSRLGNTTALEDVGGVSFLIGLGEQVPFAFRTPEYAITVRDLYARRLALNHTLEAARAGYGIGRDPMPTAQLQDFISKVPMPTQRATSHVVTGPQADQDAIEYIRLLASGHSPAIGSGFPDLDKVFCGFHPGSLTVIGARPSMGKSSLAIGISERVATKGKFVQVLSLEMKAAQIAMRQLCHAARVPLGEALRGETNEAGLNRLQSAAQRRALNGLPNYLDQPDTTLQAVERLSSHLRQAGRLDLLVIDYLGLISVPGRDGDENDTQKLGIISRALKTLAIQLDIPVVVLHQLNRSLESRPNKRPLMSDLRQSGRIEEDADNILFVYRDDYYNKDTDQPGVAEVIVGKQRQGERNVTARLKFHSESATFQSLASETIPQLL